MRNSLIIGSAVLILVGGLFYFFYTLYVATTVPQNPILGGTSPTANTGTNPINNSTNPGNTPINTGNNTGNTSVSNTLAVSTTAGGATMVKDFKKDPQTATTSNIPGHYYLAGGLNPAATNSPYSIFYVDSDESFNITLLVEPIGQVRQAAEQDLLKKLGISQADLCALKYSVLVPYSVDQAYSGTNLGFSFCPGATVLP